MTVTQYLPAVSTERTAPGKRCRFFGFFLVDNCSSITSYKAKRQ